MDIRFESTREGASDEALRDLERQVGSLPASYLDFLRRHNGIVPESNVFEVRRGRTGSIREFFSTTEVARVSEKMGGELAGVVPVGEAEGGNLLCIDLADGQVYFWDHDRWGRDGMSLVAPSIASFLGLLRPMPV